ncbi:uncharacterized protein LOC106652269 [Trichogramma pretiosum]|uniref:uncharacterized protein LOC106652269 n=1 Tax=Trichogramma pretiosum TaxID=7493 RepID=UPI0006C97781|nr:uncharacterized protein LOC106652269 [Trichogramma pretiosum]XP_023315044.1 uncharacterized protein LOC106652269 [Trichogramma pretiosum]
MRFNLLIYYAFVGIVLTATIHFGNCGKPRTKPREIRGYQPDQLMTAISFGKRDYSNDNKFEKIFMLLLQNDSSYDGFTVRWLLREMKRNPEMAKWVLKKLSGNNSDKQSMNDSAADEFDSKKPMSYF